MNKIYRILVTILTLSVAMYATLASANNQDQREALEVVPKEVWNKTYWSLCEGSSTDFHCGMHAQSAQQTTDGGYILAGYRYNDDLASPIGGAWLIKTDSSGNEQWNKLFGGLPEDRIDSVQQTKDGGYILAGSKCTSFDPCWMTSEVDLWLLKTDSFGNEQWTKTFGGIGYDLAYSVQQTKDGGYILAGYANSSGACGEDALIIKTDSFGNRQWSKTFGGTWCDAVHYVQQTKDGGYILAGFTASYGAGSEDMWLIKLGSGGNKIWDKTFGGISNEGAGSVQQTNDGGYIIAGYTSSHGAGSYDMWLVKTDAYGNMQWDKTFGGTQFDIANSVRQTTDEGYILSGRRDGNAGSLDGIAYLIMTNSAGIKQWEKTFEYGGANVVKQTKDGDYIFAGSDRSVSTKALLAKISDGYGITVTSPNGGENWPRGTTQTLKWTSSGNPGIDVKIELLKGTAVNSVILSSTPNDGSQTWIVPLTQTLGSDYKIRITSTSNSLYKDTSDNNFIISIPVNLLKNPGFETASGTLPQYWSKSQTGTKATFTYPITGRVGGKSVAIRYTTKETGKVALWQQAGIVVSPSKQYKLSGYMKLEGVTGGGTSPRYNGASLRINWYTSTGTLIKTDLITKSGTIGWAKYEKTFTAPLNAAKANVGGDLFNAAGKVTFDDLSLIRIS